MTITALPTAPSRTQDPDTFDTNVDNFVAALPTFVSEANALAIAMNFNATTDTSVSSVLIGTGSKSFTVSTAKSFQPGMYLVIADSAAPSTNLMVAIVTSYDSGTGALVVDSKYVIGSGTIASWLIAQTAAYIDLATYAQPISCTDLTVTTSLNAAGVLYSSSYTPTITNGTNVAASTAYAQSYYSRIGDRVTFNLYAELDLTAAGEFAITISLPIASNFTNGRQASGGGHSTVGAVGAMTDTAGARIISDATNDVLQVNGYSADTVLRGWTFVGGYTIL